MLAVIEERRPRDGEQALQVLVEGVGAYLLETLGADGQRLFIAQVDGKLAGAALGTPICELSRRRYHRATGATLCGQVAEMQALFVLPEMRGQGIGRQLVMARLAGFRAHGFERVLAESWVREEAAGVSAPLYRRLGFKESGPYAGYWAALPGESKAAASCPECGQHCCCSALLFELEL